MERSILVIFYKSVWLVRKWREKERKIMEIRSHGLHGPGFSLRILDFNMGWAGLRTIKWHESGPNIPEARLL